MSIFFTCWNFYFNLKQMVGHRCEQLWPFEHKEQALGFEHAPFPHTDLFPGPFLLGPSCPACPQAADLQKSAILFAVMRRAIDEGKLAGQSVGRKTLT